VPRTRRRARTVGSGSGSKGGSGSSSRRGLGSETSMGRATLKKRGMSRSVSDTGARTGFSAFVDGTEVKLGAEQPVRPGTHHTYYTVTTIRPVYEEE
jgi:hypothetical protein